MMLVPMVALLACAPSPVADLEQALGRSLTPAERSTLPDRGVALVVRPDHIEVVGFGWAGAADPPMPGRSSPIPVDAVDRVEDKKG